MFSYTNIKIVGLFVFIIINTIYNLSAGDYVQAYTYHTAGTTLSTNVNGIREYFSMHRIG